MEFDRQRNADRDEISGTMGGEQDGHAVASRRSFLRRSVMGAALAAPLGVMVVNQAVSAHNVQAAHAVGAPTKTKSPLTMPSWSDAANAFHEIQADEKAHSTFLVNTLNQAGITPRPRPTFKGLWQPTVQDFVDLALGLENLSARTYLLLLANLQNKGYLLSAGSILSIEARHAGFLENLSHRPLCASGSFDTVLSQLAIVRSIVPFVDSLRGGLDPASELSDDGALLNFALLLEYLESDFYNQNVSTYF
jgi:hypothetical protein